MGTKTIGLDDEAYEKLKAEKREGESFSDTVKRITDEVNADWRAGFGSYADVGEEFERAVLESHRRTSEGLSARQRRVLEQLVERDGE